MLFVAPPIHYISLRILGETDVDRLRQIELILHRMSVTYRVRRRFSTVVERDEEHEGFVLTVGVPHPMSAASVYLDLWADYECRALYIRKG